MPEIQRNLTNYFGCTQGHLEGHAKLAILGWIFHDFAIFRGRFSWIWPCCPWVFLMKSLELCIESIFTFWVLPPSERASGNLGFLRTRFCKNRTFKAIFLMAQTLAHGSVDLFATRVTYIFTFHKKIHGQLNALGDFGPWKWRNFEKMAFSRGRNSWRQRSPMIFFVFSCSSIHKKLI